MFSFSLIELYISADIDGDCGEEVGIVTWGLIIGPFVLILPTQIFP